MKKAASGSGRRLVIQPSSDDNKIQFIAAPGSGLDPVQASRIGGEVRKILREGLTLPPVDLPSDFPFDEFKGVGTGAEEAVALPIQLSGTAPPPGAIQSITQSFIGSSAFAFAVSGEFITSLIDIEAIREAIRSQRIRRLGATYRLRFSSGPTLTFRTGAIDISGRVEVETSAWWAPNGFVKFKQAVTLELDVATQSVRLVRLGEPNVDESWFIPHSTAVRIVRSEIDNALSSNTGRVRTMFDNSRNDFVKGLRRFDPSSSALFTEVEITPDGIIIRGTVATAARRAPIVSVAETSDRSGFTAFKSWIPGGRIERLTWSWVEYANPFNIWSGVSKSVTDEHRFVLPKPAGITALSEICLRIEGTQITPDGQLMSIAGGTTCLAPEPVNAMDVPSWWEPVTVPFWLSDLAVDVVARDALAGHITVQTDTPKPDELTRNSLVCFVDWRSENPLRALQEALRTMQRRVVALAVIVVVPPGAFGGRRRELEAKLGSFGDLRGVLHLTEDDEGGWTRMFAPSRVPATYIINARRQFVWKYEGEVDPAVLAAALDEHVLPVPPPESTPLRLSVTPGDDAPDALFEDARGQQSAIHRLRGHRLLLNFWQSWSAPCLEELRRLQRLHEQGGKGAPMIVAFHGGKKEGVETIRRQLGLSFVLVQDVEQRVARQYGVRCWPTTISVDPDGRVGQIQFGIAPDDRRAHDTHAGAN